MFPSFTQVHNGRHNGPKHQRLHWKCQRWILHTSPLTGRMCNHISTVEYSSYKECTALATQYVTGITITQNELPISFFETFFFIYFDFLTDFLCPFYLECQ